jgi:hypothetical protein
VAASSAEPAARCRGIEENGVTVFIGGNLSDRSAEGNPFTNSSPQLPQSGRVIGGMEITAPHILLFAPLAAALAILFGS